ncbi:hypothetical protein KKC13_09305 [bacterium]|nr:hypothetical protein [bacterium]MBU1957985.1 hypothetical protein [bacterium]
MIRKLEELLGLSFKIFLSTAIVVIVLGVYVANLLFGNHSLKVLQGLKNEKTILQKEIVTLKEDNARLHKKYLEWSDAQ